MFAVTADLHFHNHQKFRTVLSDGTNSRLKDGLDCFKWIVTTAVKQKCKLLVVCGDVFHTRKSIENTVIDKVCRVFKEASNKIDIAIVAGNHDYSVIGDGSLSIRALEKEHVYVFDKPTSCSIGGVSCAFVPFMEDNDELKKSVRSLKADYLFAHGGVVGGKTGPWDFEIPGNIQLDALRSDSFKSVFLGHYHAYQKLAKNVYYTGSPLSMSFDDVGIDKGFLLVEGKKVQFVENKHSPRFTVVHDAKDLHTIEAGHFVKVMVNDDDDIDIPEHLETSVQIERVKENVYKERLQVADKNDRDILHAYIDANPLPDILPSFLVEVGMSLLEEART